MPVAAINVRRIEPARVAPPPALPPKATPAPRPADTFEGVGPAGLSSAETQRRLAGIQRFIAEMSEELDLKRTPTFSIDPKLQSAGHYDEARHHITVGPSLLEWDGKRARKILTHELVHAWQFETGTLRWNLDKVGVYVDAPKGPLWKTLINPLKLGQMIVYALQPSELHAELARMTRGALRMLPAPPW